MSESVNDNKTNETMNNKNNIEKESTSGEIEKEIKDEIQKEIDEGILENKFKEDEVNKKKLEELESQISTLKEQLLRKAAEFENYKRRTENEFANFSKYANEYLITDLLPVIDDFERSLDAGREKPEFDSFFKGVELIYSKLIKTLEQRGVKVIECTGQPFDVNFHEAMLVMEKEGVPPSTVVQELMKGYILNDKVIRHSKVIVSKDSTEETQNNEQTSE